MKKNLSKTDPKIAKLIQKESGRQQDTLMMIPSENYTSPSVREAVGSILIHKYAEGYPTKRYYQGQEFVDQIENLARERAKKLFKVEHVNVQPYSGSPANTAVFFALLENGDKVMGLKLDHGGHLTHGHPKVTFSGKYFNSVPYLAAEDGQLDYEQLAKIVKSEKPKLIVAGTTAYPRILNWKKFAEIADSVDAWLMADISHIAGLVVAGAHPSPANFVHIITTTTHKTLRGPRGAMIMVTKKGIKKDTDLAKKIDKAVFPGLQGGPHLHTIAGIAVTLKEADTAKFKKYGQQVVKNAKVLAEELKKQGFKIVTDGTDNHLMVVDLRESGILGKDAAIMLEKAGIVLNYNTIPFDPNPPFNPSGIRLGTPALTTRGMKEKEMKKIAVWIGEVIKSKGKTSVFKKVKEEVKKLCQKFPLDF